MLWAVMDLNGNGEVSESEFMFCLSKSSASLSGIVHTHGVHWLEKFAAVLLCPLNLHIMVVGALALRPSTAESRAHIMRILGNLKSIETGLESMPVGLITTILCVAAPVMGYPLPEPIYAVSLMMSFASMVSVTSLLVWEMHGQLEIDIRILCLLTASPLSRLPCFSRRLGFSSTLAKNTHPYRMGNRCYFYMLTFF